MSTIPDKPDLNVEELRKLGFTKLPVPERLSAYVEFLFRLLNQIHSLPKETLEKLHVSHSAGLRGHNGEPSNADSAKVDTILNTAEKRRAYQSFDYGFDSVTPTDTIEEIVYAKNQFPSDMSSEHQVALEAYMALTEFSVQILAKLLQIPVGQLSQFFERPTGNIRLLNYTSKLKTANIPEHQDYEFLTLTISKGAAMTIIDHSGEAHRIVSEPYYFNLMTGDAIEQLTDGVFKATLHRVDAGDGRQSIVYFLNADRRTYFTGKYEMELRDEPTFECFSPAEHMAVMNLANNVSLRDRYRADPIAGRVPPDGRNPFRTKKSGR